MLGLLDDLNDEQRRVVLFQGPSLLVLAGPGSGKTRVLTCRIAYHVLGQKTEPRRVLAVTFSNRAAREMSDRVRLLVGDDTRVPVGTFHRICARLLRRHGRAAGIRPDFRVSAPAEARQIMRMVAAATSDVSTESLSAAVDAVSGLRNGVEVDQVAERSGIPSKRLRELAREYDRALLARNVLDLDGLLSSAAALLRGNGVIRTRCQEALDHLLVDEYQDTNPVQAELVELLAPSGGTVMVVGDEDQSIYGWRHAHPGAFTRFQRVFPETTVLSMQRSYRHCKFVARAANALIAHNAGRSEKNIQSQLPAGERPLCFVAVDETDEAAWIADRIQQLNVTRQIAWDEIAVLYRVNAQSRVLEDALVSRGIPYQVLSGRSFYARTHVRTVLAYLRLALSEDDDAAAETLLASLRGMGDRRMVTFRAWAADRHMGLASALTTVKGIPGWPRSVSRSMSSLAVRIASVSVVRKSSLATVLDAALEAASTEYQEAGLLTESVLEDFDELRALARSHSSHRGTLRSLIDSLTLDESTVAANGAVNLVSLHGAKGLEFRAVFLAGLEEGVLPHARSLEHDADIQEERRLCYVGITRAKEILHLSYAQVRVQARHAGARQPSRFIREIGLQQMQLKVSSSKKVQPRLATVSPGNRVHHVRWGTGTVEAVDGVGTETLTTVRFDRAGYKRMQLCHAPLTLRSESSPDVSSG